MAKFKLPVALVILTITCGIGLQLWYWPQLPEQVATHFDEKGNPHGWLDKLPATLLSTGLLILLPAFFVGTGQIVRWLPNSLINMPYREYWLALERRKSTLRWLKGWMLWFAFVLALFLLVLNHLTFVANRDAQPLYLTGFWGLMGTFLLITFVMVLLMLKRFCKPSLPNHFNAC